MVLPQIIVPGGVQVQDTSCVRPEDQDDGENDKGSIISVKCFLGGKFSRDVFRLDGKCEKLDRELIWRSFGRLAIKGPSYNPSQVAP